MESDQSMKVGKSGFAHAGIGMSMHFSCRGCKQPRPALGSRGKGLAKRCGECTAKRAATVKEAP
jgi:hypothetical protein